MDKIKMLDTTIFTWGGNKIATFPFYLIKFLLFSFIKRRVSVVILEYKL